MERDTPGFPIGGHSPMPTPSLDRLAFADRATVDQFHVLSYERWRERGWGTIDASWFGYRCLKTPLDLWMYQEIIVETRPELVIETGTNFGGSALFLASILDLLGRGSVVTIDIDRRPRLPEHPRITYLEGSSTSADVVGNVYDRAASVESCMVILDSDHSVDHVSAEIGAFSGLVTPGCYMIVEDTNVAGNPVFPEFPDGGPGEAVSRFLAQSDLFEVDGSRERFLLTMNPGGFLRRLAT